MFYLQPPFVAGTPKTMVGWSVAIVEESRNVNWPAGATVVLDMGWIERAVFNPDVTSIYRIFPISTPVYNLLSQWRVPMII